MASRKEEERNEKIIRGLMKLPPNRRCINCNSLGPQYVCTNFWTFVCMTCSGIHREFTHRVKSVSMAKFTSQEVEALQNGGNQRAREIYLKDWDIQRQRFPDNSNVNKVREFIKIVYVDRRYAGGKTSEKPSEDAQGLGSHADETRRASSYHSYSQSPPYDYQYEDRRYRKRGGVLTRKPGSDRSHYVGKISGFVYSPGRMSQQMFEDRFANEGSGPRISDHSVSSGGDPFRSGAQSPYFEKDVRFNSPPIWPSRDIGSSVANVRRDVDGIPRPQRTTSLESMGSFGSNSMSLKSYNLGLSDVSEPEQAAVAHLEKMSTFPQSQSPVNYGGLDLFQAPVIPEPVSPAAPPIDLFQLPATSSAPVNMIHTSQASSACVDLFHSPVVPEPLSSASPPINFFQLAATSSTPVNVVTSQASSTSLMYSHQPVQTSSHPSLNFFEIPEQPSAATLDRNPQELSNPKNDGWATFDTPSPVASIPETESVSPATVPGNGCSSVNFDPLPSSNTGMRWPAFENSGDHGSSQLSDPCFNNLHNVQAPPTATSSQSWTAFDNSTTSHLSFGGVEQTSESQSAPYKPSSTADQYLNSIVSQDSNNGGNPRAASLHGPLGLKVPSHVDTGPSYTPSVLPLVEELQIQTTELKSTNPFDFPSNYDLEQSNMFLDMGSLQAALPNAELSNTFLGGATQSWFPQNALMAFVPSAAQGGLAYMSGQSPTAPLPNVPTQEPVASVGGNPFA